MIIPQKALSQHLIALGKTGAGKSSTLRVIVENLLDQGKRFCGIDPKGDWWGLKLSASGKSAGYPVVIFGGEHADVPINAHAGGAVAELVATGNRPCIIDLGGWTVRDRTRFFVDFAQGLFRANKSPLWLMIDEVHNFAPQGKVMDPDSGMMLHWANRLASEGRGKAVTLLAASQRPQKTHKDFVTSMETLIAMRVIHPLDRTAIKDWIDGCPDREKGREVLDSLATMTRGEAWVWSPEIGFGPKRVAFPRFKTYDSFAAPTGEGADLKGWAEVDLDEVRQHLASVVEEAKANDPKELKRRIAELEAKLRERPSDGRCCVEAQAERDKYWRSVFGTISSRLSVLQNQAGQLTSSVRYLATEIDATHARLCELMGPDAPAPAVVIPQPSIATPPKPVRPPAASAEGLTGPQQQILDTIRMLNVRGIQATRDCVARWLGIHPHGGRYGSNLAYLRQHGYLEGFALTDVGRQTARASATGFDALLEAVPDEPKREILRSLRSHGTQTRDSLARLLGIHPNGGRYGSNLAWLRTMGVITERGPIELTEGALR